MQFRYPHAMKIFYQKCVWFRRKHNSKNQRNIKNIIRTKGKLIFQFLCVSNKKPLIASKIKETGNIELFFNLKFQAINF